jgi:hypothetical protein
VPVSHSSRRTDPAIDLDWLIDTTSILAAAETYLLITRLTGWDLDTYQNWLATTCTRLATPAEKQPAARRSRRNDRVTNTAFPEISQ